MATFIGSHFTSEPTASPVLTKWWNLELMLAANFGSPYKWLPKLVAKFWQPNSVLYQTDIGAKNLTHKGNFSHKPESTDNMPVNQVSESGIKFFLRKWPKTSKIPYFGLIRVKKGPKNWPTRLIFHTLEITHNMHVNQVLWGPIENFLRKLPKTCKISNFDLFFVIRNQ